MDLRRKPIELSDADVKSMLQKHGFYESIWNDGGKGIQHQYKEEADGKVVFDGSTGLYWQQSGFSELLTFERAQDYIKRLNNDKYGGYDDWRLPTLEEAMSLMEPEEKNGNLYVDPIFDDKQWWIWTADKTAAGRVWTVNFDNGGAFHDGAWRDDHVRAVRS